jgi:hypothetical protein
LIGFATVEGDAVHIDEREKRNGARDTYVC